MQKQTYRVSTERGGFTLIELLVVISIIALLMAILMPALARVKKQAKAVACQANLKQWGTIFAMYTDDNNGYFPERRGGSNAYGRWMDSLREYYGSEPKFRLCPMAINAVFLDYSVSKVWLKQLWQLRWSKAFDIHAPQPNWASEAPWMKNFKEN
jgi:prepilin-type N-terminal cleavage/methylation domain-containing protein